MHIDRCSEQVKDPKSRKTALEQNFLFTENWTQGADLVWVEFRPLSLSRALGVG